MLGKRRKPVRVHTGHEFDRCCKGGVFEGGSKHAGQEVDGAHDEKGPKLATQPGLSVKPRVKQEEEKKGREKGREGKGTKAARNLEAALLRLKFGRFRMDGLRSGSFRRC
jgi:hypothetical protein